METQQTIAEQKRITLELVVDDDTGNPLVSHHLIVYPRVPEFHYFGSYPTHQKLELKSETISASAQLYLSKFPIRILTADEERQIAPWIDVKDDAYEVLCGQIVQSIIADSRAFKSRVVQHLYEDKLRDLEIFLRNPSSPPFKIP